jgi:hypothetical protein
MHGQTPTVSIYTIIIPTNAQKYTKINLYIELTIPNKNYDRLKAFGECGIFQLFG